MAKHCMPNESQRSRLYLALLNTYRVLGNFIFGGWNPFKANGISEYWVEFEKNAYITEIPKTSNKRIKKI
jgi:hypothetical protein